MSCKRISLLPKLRSSCTAWPDSPQIDGKPGITASQDLLGLHFKVQPLAHNGRMSNRFLVQGHRARCRDAWKGIQTLCKDNRIHR